MNICVIGSTGFLGKNIIEYALKNNFEILIIGREKPSIQTVRNIKFIKLNLIESFLPSIILDYQLIFYCAGVGINPSEDQKLNDINEINTFIPIKLAKFLDKNKYKGKLITFGSYFEIGNVPSKLNGYTEKEIVTLKIENENNYCLSKKKLTDFFNRTNLNIDFYHCILPTIYGLGENQNRLIPYVIKGIENDDKLSFSAGNQIRQYLHIEDAINIIFLMINKNISSGIYNFPSADTLSVRKIVEIIYKHFNKILNPKFFGAVKIRDEFMPILELNSTKLLEKIDVPRLTNIKEYLLSKNIL
jgi:nucleoside-diphosphate-sugar epimerase